MLVLFLLVALIPASLLAANSAYSVFKLQEQISNLYHGILVIIVGLDDGHLSLLQMKSDILNHILTTDEGQMRLLEERIKQNEHRFSDVLANYKEIGDFPLQVEIMKRRGLENMTSSDHEFITQVRADWVQYQESRDRLLSLSGQNRNSEAAALAFGEANTRFDKLVTSYQKTVDLNKKIAQVLYEESKDVTWMAYLYSALVFAISLGIAVVIAMMLSKKMTSPVAEAQKRAKMDMDRFVAESSFVERTGQHKAQDSALKSGGVSVAKDADEKEVLLNMTEAPTPTSRDVRPEEVDNSVMYHEEGKEEQKRAVNEILSNNQAILLHAELYNTNFKDDLASFSSLFLGSLILPTSPSLPSPTISDHNGEENGYATTNSSMGGKGRLLLITRAGSNLHRKVYQSGRKDVEVYLLSLSTMAPITKSDEGLVVISFTNTTLIAEAIRRSLQENPSPLVVVFDNLTALINTVGFEKTHAFINTVLEIAQPYQNARIVFLVNKKAHPPNELQSIANMFNVFIQ